MSYAVTETETYTTTDIATVVRRFTADIVMIAQSSRAITEAKARDYAHDVELLAKEGYLKKVDLTLLSADVEVRACQYIVNTAANDLTMVRPGGVMWPQVENAYLRIVISYTSDYDDAARERMKKKFKVGWSPTNADTSHVGLSRTGGRDYASNGWGLQRQDYAA
ncbi:MULTISPECIES: hypothetical protein [Hyphococcus]|uniref:Bacterial HORMA domain-containing protein n=1 Tax=Hyphococcus luteus TaxID=2058213 RepID=A0A2S7K122_9PROT|nr:hypothetical protein [Marinicaulis flavus]PQA86215.1 hypothetical protein CW354_17840 [Marinicaulis flavus]